jgi:predicted PurR-regulated permease PerM
MKGSPISVTITPKSVITILLFLGLITFLYYVRDLMLIVLTAIVLASSIEPAVRYFMKFRLGRITSVLLVYALVLAVLGGIAFLFLPPIIDDAVNFLATAPKAFESLRLSGSLYGNVLGGEIANLSPLQIFDGVRGSLGNVSGSVFSTVNTFFGGLVSFVLIIVFSFYFAVQETGIDDFLRLVTPVEHEQYVVSLWRRSQDKIGKWMQGQLLLGLIVGVLLYLGLVILGVPYALLLAVLAAIFELIPVFGQILAALPAIAVAFGDGGVTAALLVLGLYLIVQQFESNLIYPLVVKKIVGVPPLLVILALLIGAKLAGFLGILLSVPIAAALQEFINDIQKKKDRELAHMHEHHEH